MAPKKISTNPSPSAIPPSSTKATTVVPSAAGQPTKSTNKPATSSSGQVRNAQDLQQIGAGVWNKYVDETPQRVKLLDAFLVFLIVVGVLQFLYCVIAGNFVSRLTSSPFRKILGDMGGDTVMSEGCFEEWTFTNNDISQPFNAFLSGFSATVGQFVLTVSLRMQTNPENKADFESISHERYVVHLPSLKLINACEETRTDNHHSHRAFADFIFGSMILHFFCVNFIN